MVLSLLFFGFAAICDSQMDVLKNKFTSSIFWSITMPKLLTKYKIFKTVDSAYEWLDAPNSWRLAYIGKDKINGPIKWNILGLKFKKPAQLIDGWHFVKMFMILFLTLTPIAILIQPYNMGMIITHHHLSAFIINVSLYFIMWFTSFQMSWNTK